MVLPCYAARLLLSTCNPSVMEGYQCGVSGQLLIRPCPFEGSKHGRNQSFSGHLLLCDVCLYDSPTKRLISAREAEWRPQPEFHYQSPLCLFLNSITLWHSAHVWQPGTAARRGPGMSSPHSAQCSADTALWSMR